MKKIFKKKLILVSFITIFFATMIYCLNVNADDVVIYNANEWSTFKDRSKEDIAEEYSKVLEVSGTYRDGKSDTYYKVKASTVSPYESGELTTYTHKVMSQMANYYRYLVGVDLLKKDSSHSEVLQAGALIRNFDFNHSVDSKNKPSDMDDALWTKGANAPHNIIATGYTPKGAITGWINEGYQSGTWDTLGHRLAIIKATLSEVEFGYSGRVAIGVMNAYSNKHSLAYNALPAPGYMPNQMNARKSAWSIELNPQKLTYDNINDLTVRVTNLNTNESYDCTAENQKLKEMYDFLAFVQPPSDSSEYEVGSKFKIEVLGLTEKDTKKAAKIVYTTEFFDVDDYANTYVTSISPENSLNSFILTSNIINKENLELISQLLPEKATVHTKSGRDTTLNVAGKWQLDEANKKWTNTVDSKNLPDYITDLDSVLDQKLEIKYAEENYTGYFSINPSTPTEGSPGYMYIKRYMLGTPNFKIYQITKNSNTNKYTVIEKYNNDSPNVENNDSSITVNIDSFSKEDAGKYIAIYYRNNGTTMYVAGINDLEIKEKEIKSISITSPTKNTYKVGEKLNVKGGKVNITYVDDTTSQIDLTEDMVSNFNSTSKGISTATVTYKDKTATFDNLIVDSPSNLTAEYGNTLKDIELPTDEYGTYSWQDNQDTSVGNIGTRTFKVKYTPKDSKYSTVSDLETKVEVEKATPKYQNPLNLTATYGDILSSIKLPTADNGTYEFEQLLSTEVGNAGINRDDFTVKFTPKDTTNYKTITNIPVVLTIKKAIPDFTIPQNLEAGYGDTLKDVELPSGFTWNDETLSVGEVGKNSFKATYTPKDTANYEIVTDVTIEVNVDKATPKYEIPTGLTATYGDTLADVELPKSTTGTYEWKDSKTKSVGNAGENTFEVIFTPNEPEKYRSVTIKVTITVAKADPKYEIPTDLTATYGETLADIELPELTTGTYEWQDAENTPVGEVGKNKFKLNFIPKDTNNYNTIEDIEVEITVAKANPEYKIPNNLTVEYGKKLSDISLPDEFTWLNPSESVGEVGKKSFKATYTPKDQNNYNSVQVEIPIEVVKATPNYEIPTNLTATYGETLADVELPTPENGQFEFESILTTEVGNAGVNKFYLTFTPKDQKNYKTIEHIEVSILVNKAKGPKIEIPTLSEIVYNPNKHLSDITLPEFWQWADPTIVPTVINTGYQAIYTPEDINNYDYSDQDLQPILALTVKKATPEYELPVLTAYKDETLNDVILPELSNGKFFWQDAGDTSVGEVGTNHFKVTFKPNDTDNYEIVTDIDATIEVGKSKPTYTVPTGLTATYGDTLSSVALPEGFTWNTPEALVGDAGEHIFLATFTPADTENYSSVTNIEIKVMVNKKKAEKITIPTINEMTYDPNRTLSDIPLPKNWQWANPSIVPSVGNNGYQAIYTPENSNNYDYSDQNLTPMIEIPLVKADPIYTVPDNLQIEWNSKLCDIKLPKGFSWQEDANQSVGEIGTKKFVLTYTPDDLVNYNIVTDIEVTVKVTKATLSLKNPDDIDVQWQENLKLSDIPLPDGYKWLDPDMKVTSSGSYKVIYTPEDTEHYDSIITYVKVNVLSDENTISHREVDTDETVPNTLDNIFTYIILSIISLISITGTTYFIRKNSKTV